MGQPDLRNAPMPEGEGHIDATHREQLEAQEFMSMFQKNARTFEAKGFNVLGDRLMIEMVYHDLLKAFAGEAPIDTAKISAETGEVEAKITLAIETLKSILGLPDEPPDGEPAAGTALKEPENTEAKGRLAA